MKKLEAIIFDCDGTLLDSERIYLSTWEIIGKERGFKVPLEVLLDNRGKGRDYCRANMFRAMGDDFPLDEINKIRAVMNEEVFLATEDVVKPGVRELLSWIKEHHISCAVASARVTDSTKVHLTHGGICDDFDVILGGDRVTRNKPEPDLFLKAAEELGIASENCLVIGDTSSDMKAAVAAGMKAAFVPDLISVDDEIRGIADYILEQIDDIIPIIEKEMIR